MNGLGRLPRAVAECNAGAPTSSGGMKRPYSSPLHWVSPPARIALVVLLCAQIMFLAIVRLGPSTSVWGGQGAGSSVQAATKTIRNSLLLAGMSPETQAFSDKESKVSPEVSSTMPKKRAHRKKKSTSKHKATNKKTVMKESTKSETEGTHVAHAEQRKGSGDTEQEVGRSLSAKEQLDDLLPSVDDKFLADTANKEPFNVQPNSGSEGSPLDTSVKKEDGSADLGDAIHAEPSFLSMRKAQTNSRAEREHDLNPSKIKQVVSGTEAQTGQEDQESDENTSRNEEAPENLSSKEEQNVGSGEKVEEAAIDTSVEFQATKQEEQPAVVAEQKEVQNVGLGEKVEEAASDTRVEFQDRKKEGQPAAVAEEESGNDVSKTKVAEEVHGSRDSEKEHQGGEEAASDVSTESNATKQGTQPIPTADEASESASPITKAAEEERRVEEVQEKGGKQDAVKEEAVLLEQKGHEETSSSECSYGYIYVYDLPPAFNRDIISNCTALNPWHDLCPTLSNGGLGESLGAASPLGQEGSWYTSYQFNAEIVFRNRILQHACLTGKMEIASAFYVPFYAGLDVGRYLFSGASLESRDRLSNQFAHWLSEQPAWKKSGGGADHFMMVGRITWDFRRFREEDWGSGFFTKPAMQNVTKLLIERNPWDNKEMGVPYPTNFHPQNDADLLAWQNHIKGLKRNYLFSFAGAPRDKFPNDFRHILFEQCSQTEQCRSLDCSNGTCNNNQKTMEFFMNSTFCLQPRGDSFTRRSTFDCLLAGSIPVFFWHRSFYMQYEWHLPADEGSYSVFISKQDVRNGTKIEDVLKAIAPEKVQSMQAAVIQLIPKVVYAASGLALKEKDAFDVAIDGVMRSLKGAKAGAKASSQ